MIHNSRLKNRTVKVSAVLLTLISLISVLGLTPQPTAAQAQSQLWASVIGLPVTVQLHDVFMVDERVAWAVGEERDRGVIYRLHLQNGRWEVAFETAAPAPLRAVVALHEANVWAVGDRGTIVHKDGSGWQMLPTLSSSPNLRTIQMLGAGEEGWVGGSFPPTPDEQAPRPALFHYRQGQWPQDPGLAGSGQIEHLHLAAGAGWAVGDHIWRYAEGSWTVEEEPFACGENFPCPRTLSAVRAVNADEAWAVGSRHAICAVCVTRPHVLHRQNGVWQRVLDVPSGSTNPQSSGSFEGASFAADGTGLLVGWYDRGIVDSNTGAFDTRARPLIVRYQGQQWRQETLPTDRGALNAVSLLDSGHALAVGRAGLILAYGYGTQPNPAAHVADPRDSNVTYFAPVGHTLKGSFRSYWMRNGGLSVFGYPLAEEFREVNSDTGQPYDVQYLERQRYEFHPELRGTPYEVLLGWLGVEMLQRQGRDWTTFEKAAPAAPRFFAETGHAIAPQFWDYWRTHGLQLDGQPMVTAQESLALFGYPILEPQVETNSSGDRVLTQWFERARFEYHPHNPAPYQMLLGRLAAEQLMERGW